MKHGFVRTKNYTLLLETIARMETRGAREASLILVTGEPALGKTAAVQRVSVDRAAAVFRCKATWGKRALLDEMADEFRVDKRGRNQEVQQRLIKHLAATQTPLIFDEVQHIIGATAATLECVRDITDATEVLCILVAGTADVENRLARFPQIASRIGAVVQFTPLNEADFVGVVKQCAEMEIDKELLGRLYAESGGKARLVLNGLATIERVAAANGAQKATAQMLAGVPLCADWNSRRARRS
jgi:Cdc6-like AAA superfamily ATPase